ncbi:MAG: ion transporter [Kiritimatiellae bacterium]|nr:ion transporter [Kiritimatiellia bacterium]
MLGLWRAGFSATGRASTPRPLHPEVLGHKKNRNERRTSNIQHRTSKSEALPDSLDLPACFVFPEPSSRTGPIGLRSCNRGRAYQQTVEEQGGCRHNERACRQGEGGARRAAGGGVGLGREFSSELSSKFPSKFSSKFGWGEITVGLTRRRVYEIVEVARAGDRASRVFDCAILGLIALNVLAVVLESVAAIEARFSGFFNLFEMGSVLVFTIEYALRLWSCVENPRYARPVGGRLRFALTPLLVLDLLAILPFYLPLFFPHLAAFRSLRLIRLFRLFKAARYSESLRLLGRVMREKKEQLGGTLFVLSLMLVVAGALLYCVEREAQPDAFSSIPATMWWAVATFTTVGYGDIYPVTVLGKIMASIMAIAGLAIAAIPTGIIASGFMEHAQKDKRVCPHCGKELP